MQSTLYRKANYLVLSNTGIYTFRWNLRVDNKHYQPKLSLKTRNYLEAMKHASVLAIQVLSINNPTLEDIKSIYSVLRVDVVNIINIFRVLLVPTVT